MTPTRREFLRSLGVALAALIAGGYGSSCGSTDPDWERVRRIWLELDRLDNETSRSDEYRTCMYHLMDRGEITSEVAQALSRAYSAAANHVVMSRTNVRCYKMSPLDAQLIPVREDLVRQVEMLEAAAQGSRLDPYTVAVVRAALERDIAALEREDYAQYLDGSVAPDPASAEAAHLLVRLLLGGIP